MQSTLPSPVSIVTHPPGNVATSELMSKQHIKNSPHLDRHLSDVTLAVLRHMEVGVPELPPALTFEWDANM